MNPNLRLSWALGLSLLMWLPIAFGVLNDSMSLTAGGLYFLGFLAFSWIGTGIIAAVISNYRATVDEAEVIKRRIEQMEDINRRYPRRRASDNGDDVDDHDLPPNA